jgi:hypothetical protein
MSYVRMHYGRGLIVRKLVLTKDKRISKTQAQYYDFYQFLSKLADGLITLRKCHSVDHEADC